MEMEANKETDKQPDYEEEFIFLDLEDCVYSDIPPNAPFELSIGEYQDTVGTCYIFSESDASSNERCPSDQSRAPSKQVKPIASLQKTLKFRVSAEK